MARRFSLVVVLAVFSSTVVGGQEPGHVYPVLIFAEPTEPTTTAGRKLVKVLARYRQVCARGMHAKAHKLAFEALTIATSLEMSDAEQAMPRCCWWTHPNTWPNTWVEQLLLETSKPVRPGRAAASGELPGLLARCERACAAGKHAKACKLALKAIEIDPTCCGKMGQIAKHQLLLIERPVEFWAPDPNQRMEQLLRDLPPILRSFLQHVPAGDPVSSTSGPDTAKVMRPGNIAGQRQD